jgi:hypothetical protein
MAANSDDPQRISAQDLEAMKTHDLADLLANVVLLLRRMPNVEVAQLQAAQQPEPEPAQEPDQGVIDFVSKAHDRVNGRGHDLPGWAERTDNE